MRVSCSRPQGGQRLLWAYPTGGGAAEEPVAEQSLLYQMDGCFSIFIAIVYRALKKAGHKMEKTAFMTSWEVVAPPAR